MSDSIVVKCPEYVSGMCMRAGCGGILARPYWTGTDEHGSDLYAASCPHGPELFRNLTAEKQDDAVTLENATHAAPKKYDKSLTKDWTQKKAAVLLGISERQLRSYKTNPPDAHWPGWEDPVALKQWMNQREDRDLMAQAMSRHLPYRETVTERSMKK